jgi:tetratricopeptide (TPR) repeat protein
MRKKDTINIKSTLSKEMCTNLVLNGKKYLILTEDLDHNQQIVSTRVYLDGKIISSRNIDCKDILTSPDPERKMREVIQKQHQIIEKTLKKEKGKRTVTPSKYLAEVQSLLQKKENKAALKILVQALKIFPDEPFLLSYYGCLEAIIDRNYSYGIETCLRAIEQLDETTPFGQEIFYPIFYLNLGRAYLAAKKKNEATEAFKKGLSFDAENRDLLWEMTKLGMRRKPLIPYLKRSNPINKYIGMLLHSLKRD